MSILVLWELDEEFTYDGLDRLTEAEVGTWDGSTFTQETGSRAWDLTMLGNWDALKIDTSGNGSYEAGETTDRNHNFANELTEIDPSGDDQDLTYDKAGNLRTREEGSGATPPTYTYTHDAWNRLVKVVYDDGTEETRGEYTYNGLNWRIKKRADVTQSGAINQVREMYYTADWQLIEEVIDDDADSDTDRRAQYVWGPRYIDDALLWREDHDDDGYYDEHIRYYMTDVQFSVMATIDETAAVMERVNYTPYGIARHHRLADLDGDGDTDGDDETILTDNYGDIDDLPDWIFGLGDLDRDGDVDTADWAIWDADDGGTTLDDGELSLPFDDTDAADNTIGFSGYRFAAETADYIVRHRVMNPELGRWLQRDLLAASEDSSLYLFVSSQPTRLNDPMGRDGKDPGLMPPYKPKRVGDPFDPDAPVPDAKECADNTLSKSECMRCCGDQWKLRRSPKDTVACKKNCEKAAKRFSGPCPDAKKYGDDDNCLLFATCRPGGGAGDGVLPDWSSCEAIRKGMKDKGATEPTGCAGNGGCPPGSYPIVPYAGKRSFPDGTDQPVDHHFLRPGCEGAWWHKNLDSPVSNKDWRGRPLEPRPTFSPPGTPLTYSRCKPVCWKGG